MRWLLNLFSGGLLNRVLDTVDRRIAAETDRDRVKSEIIKRHLETRADYMRSGGFWLMLIFALPLAFWWAAVLVYSVLWCADCAFPKTWTIAALPPPLDAWAGGIIVSIFGVIGVSRLR
jgi:hypothetical protein